MKRGYDLYDYKLAEALEEKVYLSQTRQNIIVEKLGPKLNAFINITKA